MTEGSVSTLSIEMLLERQMPSFTYLELLMPEGTGRSHKFSLGNRLPYREVLRGTGTGERLALENDWALENGWHWFSR
jgi:hypothetical protein